MQFMSITFVDEWINRYIVRDRETEIYTHIKR